MSEVAARIEELEALLSEIDGMQYDTEGAEAGYTEGFHSSLQSLEFWAKYRLDELRKAL